MSRLLRSLLALIVALVVYEVTYRVLGHDDAEAAHRGSERAGAARPRRS